MTPRGCDTEEWPLLGSGTTSPLPKVGAGSSSHCAMGLIPILPGNISLGDKPQERPEAVGALPHQLGDGAIRGGGPVLHPQGCRDPWVQGSVPWGGAGKSRNSSGCLILSSANETWMGLRCFAGHYPKLT